VRHFVRCASNANDGVQDHCGATCFQHERVFLLITSSLNFNWLRVHFVLAAAPGFSEMKTAVQVLDVQCTSTWRSKVGSWGNLRSQEYLQPSTNALMV
jgi:hypothetical protein